jgi:hypothetical protein
MYASLANATQFITNLLKFEEQAAKDLAYQCFKLSPFANDKLDPILDKHIFHIEFSLKSLHQEIQKFKASVQNSLYQELETYLKNGQWREADQETNYLMLQIAGKEADQSLEVEDIENFSCEDLRTIDKLWVDYSKGKFGFSVQKKVWMDCGGIPGEYDWKVYEKFADQVGWRRSEYWLSYDKLTFLLEGSKYAHLPRLGARLVDRLVNIVPFLAQRLVTCNISQI